jgi:hypothetical protein
VRAGDDMRVESRIHGWSKCNCKQDVSMHLAFGSS